MPPLAALPRHQIPGGLIVAQAVTARSRARGLAGLSAIDPDVALHLPGCRSVHTVGMRFPLDLVWLDAPGEVVRIDRGVRPWRARTCLRARSVVEVVAGHADRFLAAGLAANPTFAGHGAAVAP